MKKNLLTLITALLSAMAALAATTPAPVITIENVGDSIEPTIHRNRFERICFKSYQVTATGQGEVHLYLNGEEVENPYTFTYRGDHEYYQYESNRYEFRATAQANGSAMSETVQEYVIPHLPMYYLIYNDEDDSFSMQLEYYYDYDVTVMYKISRNGQSNDWQIYDGPFEIWRAPECIRGHCGVQVICYANGISSNIGMRSDWAEDIGHTDIFRYYEMMGNIYIASEFAGYDDTGVGFAPLYNTMCNRYWHPESHPACYSGDVEIPEEIEHVVDHTFYNCSELTSVTIPYTVTDIGEEAFMGCTGLDRVEISSLYDWCDIIFADPTSNPLFYADHLFVDGEELTDLVLDWSEDMGLSFNSYSFAGFKGLKSITFLNEYGWPPAAMDDAFYGIYDQVTLYVPYNNLETYKTDLEWGRFTHIVPFIGAGPGDVNGDYSIDVDDVTGIIGMVLEGSVPAYSDVNGDGSSDIDDITLLIGKILNGN